MTSDRTGFVIQTSETARDLGALEGKTFQVHVHPDGKLKLYTVEIPLTASRCPVVVGGEQCGRAVGHLGTHMWGGGD